MALEARLRGLATPAEIAALEARGYDATRSNAELAAQAREKPSFSEPEAVTGGSAWAPTRAPKRAKKGHTPDQTAGVGDGEAYDAHDEGTQALHDQAQAQVHEDDEHGEQ